MKLYLCLFFTDLLNMMYKVNHIATNLSEAKLKLCVMVGYSKAGSHVPAYLLYMSFDLSIYPSTHLCPHRLWRSGWVG